MEYQAYLLRTSAISVPGGLRFVAQGLTVESRHSAKRIKVTTKSGHFVRQPLATGLSRVVFRTTDEPMQEALGRSGGDRSELRIDRVPDAIATDLQQFANGLRAWIDKVEQQLAAQVAEQRKREQEEAAEDTGLTVEPEEDPTIPLSEAGREARTVAQLEKWRTIAGFKGTSTEMHYDNRGHIVWLIDLNPTGKVILRADKRTFYGSLKGATVNGFGSELEVAVRDDYWSKEDPRLAAFQILDGSQPEARRAWKARLDQLIQSFTSQSGQQRQ